MRRSHEWLLVLSDLLEQVDTMLLTMIDASTILSPSTPFTFKSGFTTPQDAFTAVIAAVPTAWSANAELERTKLSKSSSVVRLKVGAITNPSQVEADMNFILLLRASRRAKTSKSDVRRPRSIIGESKGFVELIVTDPPKILGEFMAKAMEAGKAGLILAGHPYAPGAFAVEV